jgi:serine/threonine-protein kinase
MLWPGNVRICSCHTPTVPAALPIVVNAKFRVERLIGSGGMGVVYLAVDVTLDRKVAIKTLPNLTPHRAAWLQREARTMASVLHPNLAMIFGAEQWRGTPLLIVEYLEGGTLSEYLRRGAQDVDEIIDLGIVLADVLDRVHASGVLHRDIKPSNIAYTRDGVPKLLDFGVAAILDRSMSDDERPPATGAGSKGIMDFIEQSQPLQTSASSTWRIVGTPLYLSPEAVAGQIPQPSFDLWSLSLVLYEALTGRHPFNGESVAQVIAKIQETRVPDVRDYRPDCPPELAALLRDSLSPVLVRRPATAAELRIRLQRLRASRHAATS